jgi:transcriptional regulator with GAF, ATPase, and Fis domain
VSYGIVEKIMNTQEFFREATLRICGSLDVEVFLYESFMYIRNFIPADKVVLTYLDSDYAITHFDAEKGKQVLLASASVDGGEMRNISIPVPPNITRFIYSLDELTTVILERAADFPTTAPWIASGFLHEDESMLVLRLLIDKELIGAVALFANTPGQFTQEHADMMTLLREPFAIALSNSIRYTKLQQFKELLVEDNRFLRKELLHTIGEEIIGVDFGLKGVMEMVQQVAPLSSPVLLLGETGTGKEVIASAIHNLSDRNQGSFIKVNCGAIPENLMDSELFGHEKGAFTGAISRKKGRFERANGGTIFLDEVGELQPDAQIRLLRVLQEKEIERVGGTEPIKVDIRVIAATHRNLKFMIQEGTFREDLFFRLNVFPISIPPLRERKVDIPSLLQHFLHKKAREMGRKTVPPLAPGVLDRLSAYSWPGNVRELQNAVERELIVTRGESLTFRDISAVTPALPRAEHDSVSQGFPEPRQPEEILALDDVVSQYIRRVLELTGGKVGGKGGAADLLRINPSTLRKRMRKLAIPFGRNIQENGR